MPVRISEKQERGFYVFFDVTNWRRERVGANNLSRVDALSLPQLLIYLFDVQREFVLNYDHLDQRHAPYAAVSSL